MTESESYDSNTDANAGTNTDSVDDIAIKNEVAVPTVKDERFFFVTENIMTQGFILLLIVMNPVCISLITTRIVA